VTRARSQGWLIVALSAGIAYLLIGRLFAVPAEHVQVWRLAAWAACSVVYIAHLAYEHGRLRSPVGSAALHAAIAVAMGGFLLALAGMLRSWAATSHIRPTWWLALVVWPAVTAIPAFLVALVAGMLVQRFWRSRDN
jgi:Kef-type K+ transport system membrane component KefB